MLESASLPVNGSPPTAPGRESRGPISALLDTIGSVWLGITIILLLFLYCSLGSAVPPLRQNPLLEMTEFEWFHWWPFDLLVAALVVNLTVATLWRIPFRAVNLGVWMIHTGVIILCLGSYWYFGTKIEGDALVFRREIVIDGPNVAEPKTLVALPGASQSVIIGPNRYDFTVQSTNRDWQLLSGQDKGKKVYSVNVLVQPPGQQQGFIRQVIDGYPEFTEDVIPGQGRAIKVVGKKIISDDFKLTIRRAAQDKFMVKDTWALYIRQRGAETWHQRPIQWMPRYNDHISNRNDVFMDDDLPLRPLDVEVPPNGADDPLAGVTMHVTSYLRYAQMRAQALTAQGALDPALEFTGISSGSQRSFPTLWAFDPERNHTSGGEVQFVYHNDEQSLENYPQSARATIRVEVPEADFVQDIPVDNNSIVGPQGAFSPLGKTGWSMRIKNMQPPMTISGKTFSLVFADLKTPDGEVFERWISDRPEITRDQKGQAQGAAPHAMGVAPDKRIVTLYRPAAPPVILVGTPTGVYVSFSGLGGAPFVRKVNIGEKVDITSDFSMIVKRYLPSARQEVRPYIVPGKKRDRDVGEGLAMIRLEVPNGQSISQQWVPFERYVFPDAQYAASRRYRHQTRTFAVNGKPYEIMFSRQREPLPAEVALQDFHLKTQIGGFSGSADSVFNYVSDLRFASNDGWSDIKQIEVNHPTDDHGYWYFQSTWDPPRSGAGSGMNFTGLGVGNRNGVGVQLFGFILTTMGLIYAFYIKPSIRRREIDQARQRLAAKRSGEVQASASPPADVQQSEAPVLEPAMRMSES